MFRFFCNTIGAGVQIDSVGLYKAKQSMFEVELDTTISVKERNEFLKDTTINDFQLKYASSKTLSSEGKDSISFFMFYNNGNSLYNLLNFSRWDRYLGLKLIFHSQNLLIEKYEGRVDDLTPFETSYLNGYISTVKEKFESLKSVNPKYSSLIF